MIRCPVLYQIPILQHSFLMTFFKRKFRGNNFIKKNTKISVGFLAVFPHRNMQKPREQLYQFQCSSCPIFYNSSLYLKKCYTEAYSRSWWTFKMELFAQIVHRLKLLTIFTKSSISDVLHGSQCTIALCFLRCFMDWNFCLLEKEIFLLWTSTVNSSKSTIFDMVPKRCTTSY